MPGVRVSTDEFAQDDSCHNSPPPPTCHYNPCCFEGQRKCQGSMRSWEGEDADQVRVFRAPLHLQHLAPHGSPEMLPTCWGGRRRASLSLSEGAGVTSGVCPRTGKFGRFRHWERGPWIPLPSGGADGPPRCCPHRQPHFPGGKSMSLQVAALEDTSPINYLTKSQLAFPQSF